MPPVTIVPTRVFRAKGTAYYLVADPSHPDYTMEGGLLDMKGRMLNSLQDCLRGYATDAKGHQRKVDYVSCAMDNDAFGPGALTYGTRLRIPEIEEAYYRIIDFRVVDTGGAFMRKDGQYRDKIDICVRSKEDQFDRAINRPLTLLWLPIRNVGKPVPAAGIGDMT